MKTAGGGNLRLWKVDKKNRFKPISVWELPGTDRLHGYVIHTLRPERFGGESDGDTVHLMSTKDLNPANKKSTLAELWHAQFELPLGK